jgi:hypothetical protein
MKNDADAQHRSQETTTAIGRVVGQNSEATASVGRCGQKLLRS